MSSTSSKKTTYTQVSAFSKLLGEKIKNARREQGLSQKSLAEALEVSDKAISSYEVGRTTPSLETLEKMSTIVKKPLAYFGKENPSKNTDIAEKLASIEKELQEVKELLQQKK